MLETLAEAVERAAQAGKACRAAGHLKLAPPAMCETCCRGALTLWVEEVAARAVVEAHGSARWNGVQTGGTGSPKLVVFTDTVTGSTLALPLHAVTPERVAAKIAAERLVFQEKRAP